ncbi:zinc-binding dehydrogenase [Pedococcus sp. 5OH_020]|nr:zinc-binding dehydrogenase [Pedococcus sp. 5OH_020]
MSLTHYALNIERRFALEDIGAAHQHAENGHTVGKLVVIP